ncbi:MAG: hypothetical protein LC642_00510 [Verrucomicrobiaceae bacterium]|nr:hypothetical protein [Verrucomicrobiaceae bacterium]
MTLSLQLDELPPGLRFDGVQEAGEGNPSWLQFTEMDQSSASYGASFYIDTRSALIDAILSRREEKRVEFAAAVR